MNKDKKIVRNMGVFCSESKLRIAGFAIVEGDPYKKKPSDSTRDYILSEVFKEQADCRTLLNFYSDALKGNENIYFSFAIFCDKNHAVRIDQNGNILLYYYQDRPQIGVPWDYPHLITPIGTVEKNVPSCSVMNDLKKLSALDYLLKYYVREAENVHSIDAVSEGFLVNEFLKIIIDDHITFQWIDSFCNHHEEYIADSWAETKEDIIKDLTNINLLKFGKKYIGFWGR